MVKTTIKRIGASLGVILPAGAFQALRVKKGDELVLMKTPEGFRITPYDPDFHETMKVAGRVMRRYKDALRELAK